MTDAEYQEQKEKVTKYEKLRAELVEARRNKAILSETPNRRIAIINSMNITVATIPYAEEFVLSALHTLDLRIAEIEEKMRKI